MSEATIILGDCAERMSEMSDNSVQLVVTSPPYDDLRSYSGNSKFDFETISKQIFRVLCDGGVVCWNVGAQVVDGSESLAPFKQAVWFVEACGLNLHDTMLYAKLNGAKPDHTRYNQCFEYVFILSKGRPRAINLIKDKPNVTAGKSALGRWTVRQKDGLMKEREYRKEAAEFGVRPNIWVGNTRGQEEMCQPLAHPAMMPRWLARDLIISWSNQDDTVLDPFVGSGTVCEEAIKLNRIAIGIDSNPEYVALAKRNCENVPGELKL